MERRARIANGHPAFRMHLVGRVGFVEMVNPVKEGAAAEIFERIDGEDGSSSHRRKEKAVHSTTLRFAQDDRSPIGLFENSASS